jgi:HEAT repeat protein
MRHVPGFADALERLRSGLAAREVETVVNAAKALGPLHDLPAIERLIELTGSDTKAMSQAAADALREITKQTLGLNYAKWCDWWESNRDRPRAAWLVEGLRHRDFDIRLSAIDELVRAVNDNFGYYADAPKAERDGAVQRWIVWYQHEGDRTPID